ncbi:MAG: class I SAM-dependent methyltransferase, partial [Lachnospiraceae bacterium]|nr:class I SAM-dependent methyltransferase [Lachnospiraceae bacterium]
MINISKIDNMVIDADTIEKDVLDYWTIRTPSFSKIRENEIMGDIGKGWRFALRSTLPINRYKKILDVGTGTGFFSILLSRDGYRMTGIDLTPAMIEESKREAEKFGSKARFMVMDAQELDFEDASFDAVITRNLTWTLPDVERAYKEWFRVIRPGGRLINYDANYAKA